MVNQALVPMLMSYLVWSLNDVSGSQEVALVHNQSVTERKT